MTEPIVGALILALTAAVAFFTADGRHLLDTAGEAICNGFDAVRTSTRQTLCGLHGHCDVLHFEDGHVSLLCENCWRQTPGWSSKR